MSPSVTKHTFKKNATKNNNKKYIQKCNMVTTNYAKNKFNMKIAVFIQ